MHRYALSHLARNARSSAVRDLLRQAHTTGMISLAGGLPAEELLDVAEIANACARTLGRGGASLQYGGSEGQPSLRAHLAGALRASGVEVEGHSILVTTGSQQALDLLARALIDPGDHIVVERPTYLAALQAFALCRPAFVTIGHDADGALVGELDQLVHLSPKFVYVVTNFANPTGCTMSLERRLNLLAWAAQHRVLVIEDDPYGDLRTDGAAIPSLLELSGRVAGSRPWVVLVTTLSKTVAPGFRIGWAVLPEPVADAVLRIKQATDLHTSTFTQEVAAEYLASGALAPHLVRVREEYRARRKALCEALRAAFKTDLEVYEPEGGMFVWAKFADGIDTRALLSHAIARGVCFVPGDTFYPDNPDTATMRLNFTSNSAAVLVEGVARLKEAYAEASRGRPGAGTASTNAVLSS